MKAHDYNRQAIKALERAQEALGIHSAAAFARRLADRAGGPPNASTYQRWIRGDSVIPAWALLAAAEEVHMPLDSLFAERAADSDRLIDLERTMHGLQAQVVALREQITAVSSQQSPTTSQHDGGELQMEPAARQPGRDEPHPTKELKGSTTDGRPILVAAIVPHPEGRRQQVLMTERRFATERVWSWVSGHVRQDEEPVDAVLRELNEELVVQDASVVRHLGTVDTQLDLSRYWGRRFRHGYRMLHFQVAIASPTVEVVDHEELQRAEWRSLDQVNEAVASLPSELAEAAMRFARQATDYTFEPRDPTQIGLNGPGNA